VLTRRAALFIPQPKPNFNNTIVLLLPLSNAVYLLYIFIKNKNKGYEKDLQLLVAIG
jgi:hypothetical protein